MTGEQQVLGPWPRGRWAWVAGLGVAVLVVLTVTDLAQHYYVPLGAVLALALARGVALALAWPRPRIAVLVSLAVTVITAVVTTPVSTAEPWPFAVTAVFGQSFVLAIIGARGIGRRELVAWWGLTLVVGVIATVLSPERGSWTGLLTVAILTGIAVAVGDLLRSRAETSRRLVEQEDISRAERDARARLQERARIARELHDVVAHHLSVVVVRADSAPHRLKALPDDVRQEFAAIADDARSSLTEMRRVLRLLRDAPGEQPPMGELGPQPGLESLAELIATTRRAGADVELEFAVPDGLDPAVELTAYRVIQEALSNAVRHAPQAAIRVKVRRSGGDLAIRVWNSPRTATRPTAGSGHGLVGMRERVALVDGVVSTGPTPEGGYLVEASLPVEEVVVSGDQGAGRR